MSKMGQTMVALGVVAGLGVAALPLSSYATEGDPLPSASETIEVTATVKNAISLELTAAADSKYTPASGETPGVLNFGDALTANGDVVKGSLVATVVTSNENGYTLTLVNNDETTSMVKSGSSAEIEAVNDGGASTDAEELNGEKSQWGYNTDGGNKFKGVKSSADGAAEIASASVAGSQATTVTFGVRIVPGQESGTYSDHVVFTATATAAPAEPEPEP